MTTLTELENTYDGPIPPAALAALRNQTTEQKRAAKLRSLQLDIEFYAKWRDMLVVAKPGEKVGSHENATAEWIATELTYFVTALDEAHVKLIAFAGAESAAACDRAAGYRMTFLQAAAE